MSMRGARWLRALLLLPFLTACALGPAKQAEPEATPPITQVPPTGSNGPAVPGSAGLPRDDWRPLLGASDSPASATGPGLFLVDGETGQSEFWPTPDGYEVKIRLTADSRFVWVATAQESLLADRQTGQSYRWTQSGRLLVGVAAESLLWEELGPKGEQTGRFQLARHDGTQVNSFSLPVAVTDGSYLYARTLGATNGAFLIGQNTESDWRIDLATGVVTEVPRLPSPGRQHHAETGRQYTVDVYRNTLPVVTIHRNGQPEYQVLGAYTSCNWGGLTSSSWRADGGGLVLYTADGPVMADLAAKRFEPLTVPGEGYWVDPVPSPAQSSRWGALTETQGVVTLSSFGPGNAPVASASITWNREGLSLDAGTRVWSPDGRYLQFQAFHGGGKGWGCIVDEVGEPFLPPLVQRAPFPAIAVQVATGGDCLNLRAEPSTDSRVLTCLKDGTRLSFLEKPQGGNGPYVGFYPGWALVRTAAGAEGWVSTEGRYLAWAE